MIKLWTVLIAFLFPELTKKNYFFYKLQLVTVHDRKLLSSLSLDPLAMLRFIYFSSAGFLSFSQFASFCSISISNISDFIKPIISHTVS